MVVVAGAVTGAAVADDDEGAAGGGAGAGAGGADADSLARGASSLTGNIEYIVDGSGGGGGNHAVDDGGGAPALGVPEPLVAP